jgi:hypothetical protein
VEQRSNTDTVRDDEKFDPQGFAPDAPMLEELSSLS